MALSELDGFLTAIAIGPNLVMPSEWLPDGLGATGARSLGGVKAIQDFWRIRGTRPVKATYRAPV